MAEWAEIAGQSSLVLNTKEALSIRANGFGQDTIDTLLDDHNKLAELGDPNNFPVFVYNGFVLPQGGVYSDKELRVGIETGHIVCDPAPTEDVGARINGTSIDVTLGNYFYTAGQDGNEGLYNPFDFKDTMRYYNIDTENPDESALVAQPWGEARKHLGNKAVARLIEQLEYLPGIPDEHPVILLRPNERILAHTNEFIGILPPGTTSMQARSSFGRIGVSVCYDAGWGDPGFADRWTKEIKNHNENEYVPLPVGIRDAQIVFQSSGPVAVEYSQASGNYQKASFAAAHQELERELGQAIHFGNFDPTQISRSGLHMVSRRFRRNVKRNWRPSHTIPQLHTNTIHPLVPVKGLSDKFI